MFSQPAVRVLILFVLCLLLACCLVVGKIDHDCVFLDRIYKKAKADSYTGEGVAQLTYNPEQYLDQVQYGYICRTVDTKKSNIRPLMPRKGAYLIKHHRNDELDTPELIMVIGWDTSEESSVYNFNNQPIQLIVPDNNRNVLQHGHNHTDHWLYANYNSSYASYNETVTKVVVISNTENYLDQIPVTIWYIEPDTGGETFCGSHTPVKPPYHDMLDSVDITMKIDPFCADEEPTQDITLRCFFNGIPYKDLGDMNSALKSSANYTPFINVNFDLYSQPPPPEIGVAPSIHMPVYVDRILHNKLRIAGDLFNRLQYAALENNIYDGCAVREWSYLIDPSFDHGYDEHERFMRSDDDCRLERFYWNKYMPAPYRIEVRRKLFIGSLTMPGMLSVGISLAPFFNSMILKEIPAQMEEAPTGVTIVGDIVHVKCSDTEESLVAIRYKEGLTVAQRYVDGVYIDHDYDSVLSTPFVDSMEVAIYKLWAGEAIAFRRYDIWDDGNACACFTSYGRNTELKYIIYESETDVIISHNPPNWGIHTLPVNTSGIKYVRKVCSYTINRNPKISVPSHKVVRKITRSCKHGELSTSLLMSGYYNKPPFSSPTVASCGIYGHSSTIYNINEMLGDMLCSPAGRDSLQYTSRGAEYFSKISRPEITFCDSPKSDGLFINCNNIRSDCLTTYKDDKGHIDLVLRLSSVNGETIEFKFVENQIWLTDLETGGLTQKVNYINGVFEILPNMTTGRYNISELIYGGVMGVVEGDDPNLLMYSVEINKDKFRGLENATCTYAGGIISSVNVQQRLSLNKQMITDRWGGDSLAIFCVFEFNHKRCLTPNTTFTITGKGRDGSLTTLLEKTCNTMNDEICTVTNTSISLTGLIDNRWLYTDDNIFVKCTSKWGGEELVASGSVAEIKYKKCTRHPNVFKPIISGTVDRDIFTNVNELTISCNYPQIGVDETYCDADEIGNLHTRIYSMVMNKNNYTFERVVGEFHGGVCSSTTHTECIPARNTNSVFHVVIGGAFIWNELRSKGASVIGFKCSTSSPHMDSNFISYDGNLNTAGVPDAVYPVVGNSHTPNTVFGENPQPVETTTDATPESPGMSPIVTIVIVFSCVVGLLAMVIMGVVVIKPNACIYHKPDGTVMDLTHL